MKIQPIDYQGEPTLSLRQLDSLNNFSKGTTFRLFKRFEQQLELGRDYYYLPATEYAALISQLKAKGHMYASSQHLLLLTQRGYQRLQALSSQQA